MCVPLWCLSRILFPHSFTKNVAFVKGEEEDEEEEEEEDKRNCYVIVEETRLRLLLSQQCRTEGCPHPCHVRQTTRGWISFSPYQM